MVPIPLRPFPLRSSSSAALVHVCLVPVTAFPPLRPVRVRTRVSRLAVLQVPLHVVGPFVVMCAVGLGLGWGLWPWLMLGLGLAL